MTTETTDEFTDLSNYIIDETPDLYADYSYLQAAEDDDISSCGISSDDQATVEAAIASLQPGSSFFGTATDLLTETADVALGATAGNLKQYEGVVNVAITSIGTYTSDLVSVGDAVDDYVLEKLPFSVSVTPSALPVIAEWLEKGQAAAVLTDAIVHIASSQDYLTTANEQMIAKGTALLVAAGAATFLTGGLDVPVTLAYGIGGFVGSAWDYAIEHHWDDITSVVNTDEADSKTAAQIGADVCAVVTDDVQAIFDSTGSTATDNLTGMAALVPDVGSVARNLAQDLGAPPPPLTAAIEGALAEYGAAPHETDPLVIDLSTGHTGITLTTYNAATTTTFYDLDNTGFAEQTAWTSGTTGFLVQQNTDGTINLFGTSGGDGFADLAKLDSDHNLKIDANDAAWSSLKVWEDSNGNGVVDSGELVSLSSLGITSIDLAGVTSSTSTIDGNPISHSSTVTFSDGSTTEIADAQLVHSTVNTFYDGSYTLDPDTLFLPDLRGYGTLPELAVAMSEDSTLKGEVADFASGFGTSGFASFTDSDIATILYQWAGVESVDPSSRGPDVDARQLEFLEHLFGQNFIQLETQSANPALRAAQDIDASWNMILDQFKDDLVLQAGGSALFANPVTYDPWTGTISGDTTLSQTGIMALDASAPSPGAENVAYWVQIAHFLDSIAGLSTLTSTENGWLNDAVQASDSSLTWDDVKSAIGNSHPGSLIEGTSSDDVLYGTGADDTIYGNGGHDLIYAGDGNVTVHIGADSSTVYAGNGTDTIFGGNGGDTIYCGDGTDLVHGGTGNNIVYCGAGIDTVTLGDGANVIHLGTGGEVVSAGTGNDTYYYEGGNALLTENGGSNLIVLPSGITAADVSFWRIGNPSSFDDLLIQINDGTTIGTIQVIAQFYAYSTAPQVQTLEFADSSTIDLTSLTSITWALTGNESVIVPSGSGDTNVQLSGGGNNLTLNSGSNTIDFISGNNHAYGGSGNDTYIAGPGFNVISDGGGTNTIDIPAGYTMDDVTLSRVVGTYNDLLVTIAGLGEIQIVNQFYTLGDGIQNLHFLGDSSTVAMTDLTIDTIGTAGNDYALSGVTVNAGGNWFDGRGGNDYMTGGVGDNTFNFSAGFGTSTVNIPYHTGNTNVLELHGIDPSNIRMWTDSSGALYLQDTADTSHSITVYAGKTGSGTDESAIGSYLEQIKFDDGTTWNVSDGLTLTAGNGSAVYLYGTPYDDTLIAGTGTDLLYGNGGNNTLIASTGADYLYAGAGNNTFSFSSGFNNDDVYATASAGTNTVHLAGIDPADVVLSTDSSGYLHIEDTTNPSYNITVVAGTTGSGTHESTIGDYISSITFDPSYSTTWDMTSGLTLTASNASSYTLYGTAHDDTLLAGTGTDYLYGNGGDNTLIASSGTDDMYGGSGNNTFSFSSGFENDDVYATASAGTNTIHLAGIDPADVRLWTDTNGYLHIEDTTNPSYNITVIAGTTGSGTHESTVGLYVQQITFDGSYGSGATIDLTGGLTLTASNSGSDTLYGTQYSDTLLAGTGTDYLYGNGGDNTLIASSGLDYMYGGSGSNMFSFSSGFKNDSVTATADAGTNTIHLAGIDPSHVRLWTDTSGYLHIQDTTNPSYNISVVAGMTDSGTHQSTIGHYVQQITFDESYGSDATIDLTGGLTLTASNSGSDTLYGTQYSDTLIAGTGTDTMYGNGGNNTLIAGSGFDLMYGGSGNNTFSFSAGFHSDYVYATASAGTNTIHLSGVNPDDVRLWTDTSGYLHVEDTTNSSYNISVVAGTTGSGSYESTVGHYVQQITFDSGYGTTWDMTGGLTQSLSNSGGTLYGTGYGDTLNGGTGSDSIYANAGNNTIYGGGGNDSVHLGTGSDTLIFKGATAETGVDTIYNFDTAKDDKIDISDVISTYDPLTMDISNFVHLTTSGSDTQLKVDTDGSGTSYTQIATISGVTGLNLSDLITDGNLIVHHA